ncbi:MAG: hypothetical protein RL621_311 [Bacteroidota bacterium]|jgi:hypothetical protein
MIKLVTEQMVEKIPDYFTGIVYYEDRNVLHLKGGKYHREDGPAFIRNDGYQAWWFENKLHNLNGPAVIYPDGYEEYWIYGKQFSKENWEKEIAKLKNPCKDVFVEVDGKKYKLVEV